MRRERVYQGSALLGLRLADAELLARHYQDIAASAHNDMVWTKLYVSKGYAVLHSVEVLQITAARASAMAIHWLDVCNIMKG